MKNWITSISLFLASSVAFADNVARITFRGQAAHELTIAGEISESLNLNCSRKRTMPSSDFRPANGANASVCYMGAEDLVVTSDVSDTRSVVTFSGDAADDIAQIAEESGSSNLNCERLANGRARCTLEVENLVVTGLGIERY